MYSTFSTLMAACSIACFMTADVIAVEPRASRWVETQLLNPRAHPDDSRRHVQPPDWGAFGNQTHFVTMRNFKLREGRLVDFAEDFERNTRTFDLGDVIWPNARFLAATNLADMVAEMKRRKLFLFDIWGYVPGSGPGPWHQFDLAPETAALFETLGDHWLGMDMGEQDGRYVLGYAKQMPAISEDRFAQYLYFHSHMAKIAADEGNKLAGLVAINTAHYLGKEGIYTMLGAETAQMHPNGQVFYAFIRGAGKQYGVPWFGNASVFNRWGWKTYDRTGENGGPTKGTSLALMKRLLYSHILYNCIIAGFEGGWIATNGLTPLGKIQQSAQQWVRAHGQPGVMQTPIALMLDFRSGWIFPTYNNVLYRVWGNLPYGPGDYLANDVFGMIYPGYQDSSFFHDETGFATATPYGDTADVLLSDAPGWLLQRYPLLVVASELAGGAEVRDKLQAYVERGGRLYITAGSLKNLPGGLAGITVDGPARAFAAGQKISFAQGKATSETMPFELIPLRLPADAKVLARAKSTPAVVAATAGKGEVVVFTSPFGLGAKSAVTKPVERQEDVVLPNPYPLLGHVQRVLDAAFREQALFEAGEGLSVITSRRGAGDYVLGIGNNALTPRPLKVASHVGGIESIEDIPLDQSEKTAVGYLPEGLETAAIGRSDAQTIAGGDFRIFRVRVAESGVSELPAATPPPAPRGRFLALRGQKDLKTELLARPTFFQHYDGIALDWQYLAARDAARLNTEAGWVKLQNVRIIVDLSSGVNLFPDLRLVNNIESEYQRSLEVIHDILGKMPILGASNLVLSLHTSVENNLSLEDTWIQYARALQTICRDAESRGVSVCLRNAAGKMGTVPELLDLIARLNAPNLTLAVATGPLLTEGGPLPPWAANLKGRVAFWFVSAPRYDVAGRVWTGDAPVHGSGAEERLAAWIQSAPEAAIVAQAVCRDLDEEYLDAMAIRRVSAP